MKHLIRHHMIASALYALSVGHLTADDAAPASSSTAKPADSASSYEAILVEKNIGATSHALAEYLTDLHPTEDSQQRSKLLIEQLGADSFQVRERATSKLSIMLALPIDLLVSAAEGADAEVRFRAKRILAVAKREPTRVIQAAFKVIAEKRIKGLVPELLAIIPLCDNQFSVNAAQEALSATATPGDAKTLKEAGQHERADVRAAATEALAVVLQADGVEFLSAQLEDEADQVRLAAARGLANQGKRSALLPLADLLTSEDARVRVSASSALQQLSGERFGFAAVGKADQRVAAAKKWAEWVAGAGAKAELNHPLKKRGLGYLGGNTLLAYGLKNKVAEYDTFMNEIWSFPAKYPSSAEKLPNGNVLIAEIFSKRVIVVTPEGKVVWEYKTDLPTHSKVTALDNGNILICYPDKVTEVDPQKQIVWQFETPDTWTRVAGCHNAHRLENGNTLIAHWGKGVVEVTPAGQIVWEYDAKRTGTCSPLPSGNILITSGQADRVYEVTRDKEVVWEFLCEFPDDAFRLPNGNTLITIREDFIEVTPDKKIVWTLDGCNHGTARR